MQGKSPEAKVQSSNHFESDTQKIVRRHLEDPNHTITEEELRNVRIGMTPVINPGREDLLDETPDPTESNNYPDEAQSNSDAAKPWNTVEP